MATNCSFPQRVRKQREKGPEQNVTFLMGKELIIVPGVTGQQFRSLNGTPFQNKMYWETWGWEREDDPTFPSIKNRPNLNPEG